MNRCFLPATGGLGRCRPGRRTGRPGPGLRPGVKHPSRDVWHRVVVVILAPGPAPTARGPRASACERVRGTRQEQDYCRDPLGRVWPCGSCQVLSPDAACDEGCRR
ncbi:hypothetical protein FRACA_300036 [Frankia canadensis]|uniref:Uncharacterized protein n=1 Tax=Frankia canadensis TaxID=1836972 RepID=A0A2I2KU11_9ACTN|nr:hypothetical protein FRACA_300036 [Frankia canadensis]SOU56430.1 hypothetical protein FRACA_300036 [Frankia canadensis]